MTANLFDYFEELPAGDGNGARWAARAPRRPHKRFDLKLVPRLPGWQEDPHSLQALAQIESEPWVAAVMRDSDGVRLRLRDGWVETAGAALEAGGSAEATFADLAQGRRYSVQFWDANAIRDPAWGYGFGNHVVLRYDWANLPTTTRNELSQRNLTGAYAYVIYGHMNRVDVQQGQQITNGTQLGVLGNTGNSTGHHLHLELHFSLSAQEYDYFNRLNLNPRIMYKL